MLPTSGGFGTWPYPLQAQGKFVQLHISTQGQNKLCEHIRDIAAAMRNRSFRYFRTLNPTSTLKEFQRGTQGCGTRPYSIQFGDAGVGRLVLVRLSATLRVDGATALLVHDVDSMRFMVLKRTPGYAASGGVARGSRTTRWPFLHHVANVRSYLDCSEACVEARPRFGGAYPDVRPHLYHC